MKTINCTNSASKSVRFFFNGGSENDVYADALQDGEFWFEIGHGRAYRSLKSAVKAAAKEMAKHGYILNA